MAISKQRVYIGDFYNEAQKLKGSYGKTNLFSTGHGVLDTYFGGGFGRRDGYEILVLFGPPGIGKSTVALNLVAPAIRDNKKVGLLILEDDMADVSNRLEQILLPISYNKMNENNNVQCLPQDALIASWTLKDLLAKIEEWFTVEKHDLILLDHLQFAFEGAESIKGENEYVAQRIFMQSLNQLMKRVKKTIILVSHINKENGAKGMNKIMGSSAIAQVGTKVIEVLPNDVPDNIELNMRKSRFTKNPGFGYCMKMIDSRLEQNT